MFSCVVVFLLVSHSLAQEENPGTTKVPAMKTELQQLGDDKCDILFQSVSNGYYVNEIVQFWKLNCYSVKTALRNCKEVFALC